MCDPRGGHAAVWPPVALVVGGGTLVAAVALAVGNTTTAQFDEGGLVTWCSALLLLSAAGLAAWNWRQGSRHGRPTARAWLLASGGFVFLALDETLRWHEKMDRQIHRWLGDSTTPLSTIFDDLIVGAYGAVAAVFLVRYRAEFMRVPRVRSLLVIALVVLALDVALDLVGHRETVGILVPRGPRRRAVLAWITVLEETLKIVVEGLVVVAFWFAARPVAPAATGAHRAR